MLPIRKQLDLDDHYDGVNIVQYIVLHDTGNNTDTDEGNANYFCSGSRGASAHYFVDDNSITQVVEDKDGAWHCGDGDGKYGITNRNSIGIEMCRVNNAVSPRTEANAIELVKYLMAKYNVPITKVCRHYDASRKLCPASFSANSWSRWFSFKAKLVAPQPIVNSNILALQKALNRLRFVGANRLRLSEDGQAGDNTQYATKSFQIMAGLTADGVAGSGTWSAINAILAKPTCQSGSKGVAVRYIQFRIKTGIDGVFGSGTAGYVRNWQSVNGLSADGVVGNGTWTKMIG